MDFSQLPQITFKKAGCDAKEAIRQNTTVFMCRVFGEAAALKTKEARNGDTYSYLVGEFRIINSEGKGFESGKLFLPGGIMEQIEAALKAAEGRAVQFGYDVFSTVDVGTSIGYRYAAKSLLKTEASDRLATITEQVGDKLPVGKKKAEAK